MDLFWIVTACAAGTLLGIVGLIIRAIVRARHARILERELRAAAIRQQRAEEMRRNLRLSAALRSGGLPPPDPAPAPRAQPKRRVDDDDAWPTSPALNTWLNTHTRESSAPSEPPPYAGGGGTFGGAGASGSWDSNDSGSSSSSSNGSSYSSSDSGSSSSSDSGSSSSDSGSSSSSSE
jgi:uncharacterized membrane protein YgcG